MVGGGVYTCHPSALDVETGSSLGFPGKPALLAEPVCKWPGEGPVQNTSCSSRELEFDSQQPPDGSLSSVTSVVENSMPSSKLCRHQVQIK